MVEKATTLEEKPMTERGKRAPGRASKIAATGIGVAAMAGLVTQMEVGAASQAKPVKPPVAPPSVEQEKTQHLSIMRQATELARLQPIVLTPHVVVHTVTVQGGSYSGGYAATGYSSGSGGYVAGAGAAAAAPAPAAAAPVASTGGSHP